MGLTSCQISTLQSCVYHYVKLLKIPESVFLQIRTGSALLSAASQKVHWPIATESSNKTVGFIRSNAVENIDRTC